MSVSTRTRMILFTALANALFGGPVVPILGLRQALAQEAAPEPPVRANPQNRPGSETSTPVVWMTLAVPAVLLVTFLYFSMRRQRGMLSHVDESMVISRKMLQIAEESLALQKETVRLLLARPPDPPEGP